MVRDESGPGSGETAQQVALITGGSTGIGYELARLFAADGTDLVLVSRTEATLRDVEAEREGDYGVDVTVVPLDLSVPGSATELYETVAEAGLVVETLVNDAGFSMYGRFVETDIDEELEMIQLNLATLTHLTKLFGAEMARRGDGRILNLSSMAGVYPCPTGAVYSATKHYVLAFSEALADELSDDGVTVTALCPGPTETPIFQRGDMQASQVVRQPMMDAATVARSGYEGLRRGRRVVVPGRRNKVQAILERILRRTVAVKMARRIWEPADTDEVDVENPETAYEVVREYMRRLYRAGLIHGDLSEYNMIIHEGELVVIDMGQAVTVHHPNAGEFLDRDCENVAAFFTRQGIDVDPDDLRAYVTEPDPDPSGPSGAESDGRAE